MATDAVQYQDNADQDENAKILLWNQQRPRKPRTMASVPEHRMVWLACSHCGHKQTIRVQYPQVMRQYVCDSCHKISNSRVPS